jgi:DNA-binding CsgD family transcriptional regulator/tetratricopeptide (TPR) repeat protein
MGKTALIESAAEAAETDWCVLRGGGSELERDVGFGVARQLFEPALVAISPSEREALLSSAALLGALAIGVAGDKEAPARLQSRADPSFAALHGLYWLTANLAARSPVLLLVDDAQWADSSTSRFLAYLSRRVGELRILLVVAARPREPSGDTDLIFELSSQPLVKVLQPSPLSPDAVAAMVRSSLGESAADEFCEACHAVTRGNPFFVTELLRGLETDGVPPTAGNAPRLRAFEPVTVSRAVLARLARLPKCARETARASAVLGPDAFLRHVASLAGLKESEAASGADALVGAEILAGIRPLEFVHPLVRTVIYENIPPAQRAVAHASAARLLAAEAAPPGRVAAQLMLAEVRGDPWVVDTLRSAATEARRRASTDVAVSYLRRSLAEPPAPTFRPTVLRELGEAELQLGEPAPACEHLTQALDSAIDAVERAEIALALSQAQLALGDAGASVATAELGVGLVENVDRELTLRLKAEICTAAQLDRLNLGAVADRLARYAAELEGETSAERLLLASLAFEQVRLDVAADHAVGLAERALRDGELIAELGPDAPPLYWAIWVLIESDRFTLAKTLLDQAVVTARAQGSALGFAMASSFRSRVAYCEGRLSEAESAAQDAIEVIELHDWQLGFPLPFAFLAAVLIERGELARAEDAIAQSGAGKEVPKSILFDSVLWNRAHLRMAQNRPESALSDLDELKSRYDQRGVVNPPGPQYLGGIALARLALGEREKASGFAASQLDRARIFAARRPLSIALRTAGLVEGGDRGIDLLRESVNVAEASGALLELAKSLYELGAALRRAGRRTEARDFLRQALDLASKCCALALVDRAHDELITAGARPRRERITGVESLTVSERRVAEMAARGMTNREIAQALFVTMKTVAVHLTHTYQKLDISSRAELGGTLDRERVSV